jgi:hypothetical protein
MAAEKQIQAAAQRGILARIMRLIHRPFQVLLGDGGQRTWSTGYKKSKRKI